MKTLILTAALILITGLTSRAFAADAAPAAGGGGAAAAGKGVLYHVVSFKFKEGSTPEQIKGVEEAFGKLKEQIPGIASLHWGTNVSPEKHAKGFTHCFVLTFATEKDRDDYLVHPDHKAFGKTVGPVVADVFVIDFWSGEAAAGSSSSSSSSSSSK